VSHTQTNMEDLNVDDILAGLGNAGYADHHVLLLQLLSNRVCEEEFNKDGTDTKKVIEFAFQVFRSIDQRSAEEIDLLFTVLSNMTQQESNCDIFLGVLSENEDKMALFKSMINIYLSISRSRAAQIFVSETLDSDGNCITIDPFQKMSYLLCNLSRQPDGRRILLDRRPPGYFPYLLQQVC
jgi:hypothetical protein